MAFSTLRDVYIDQLQDLYSANNQAAKVTRELAAAAKNDDLKAALERGVTGIEQGKTALEGIIKSHGAAPTGEFCKGMEGIVKEARAHALDAEFEDADVQDAVIVTQYQRMAHYAIAGYGCIAAFARRLELDDESKTIRKHLEETYEGDDVMTNLAVGGINKKAA